MHTNSLLAFQEHILPLVKSGMAVLELGPGRGRPPFKREAYRKGATYSACEITNRSYCKVKMLDGNRIDVPDGSYDVVLSANVLEHVKEPWLWFPEQARVCRPGGYVAVVSPVSWEQHTPNNTTDSWRILPDGIRTLFTLSGLITKVATLVEYGKDTEHDLVCNRGLASIDLVAVGRKPA